MSPSTFRLFRWRGAPLIILALGILLFVYRQELSVSPSHQASIISLPADRRYPHAVPLPMTTWSPPPSSINDNTTLELLYTVGSGPTSSAHGSSLVVLPDGGVLAAWFGGSREGARDVAIYSARRQPDGSSWSTPTLSAKVSNEAHWNAVLFWKPPQRAADSSLRVIVLHFKAGNSIQEWRTFTATTADQGDTWSSPVELVPGDRGGRGCVKNKPLFLHNGDILAGASLELGRWRAFVDISTDGGRSWTATPEIEVHDEAGVIQPTLWQSRNGAVHMLLRSDMGRVYRADSPDAGRSWQKARATEVPNNNSGLDVAQLADGVLVLAYNPVEGDWAARYPLRLAVSEDDGDTWPAWWDVEVVPGEFSYPAVIPWADGTGFCLTYTWNRRTIAFVSMSLAQLRTKCTHTAE